MMTDAQVSEARAAYAAGGMSGAELARRYGMSRGAMNTILRGESRKHAA